MHHFLAFMLVFIMFQETNAKYATVSQMQGNGKIMCPFLALALCLVFCIMVITCLLMLPQVCMSVHLQGTFEPAIKFCVIFIFLGQIPVVQLNFAALSNETPFNRDTVESCVKEVLQALSRSVQAKRNVEFHFAGIGRLSIRESKVKMKFYKEFLRTMDGSGSLVHALSNVSTSTAVKHDLSYY